MLTMRDAAFSPSTSAVRKSDLADSELLYLDETDLELKATHDIDSWNGYTYVLGHKTIGFAEGGVEVFDGTTHLGTWMLSDTFPTIDDLPGVHTNSISVSDAGEIIVSLHYKDAILGIDGDPASPTFLQTNFQALGNDDLRDPLPDPDYVPASDTLFEDQHNPSRHGDTLWVFDNLSQRNSRAVHMSMNSDGTLTELESYAPGRRCLFQGGALPVTDGLLFTCATSDDVFLFRQGNEEPEWEMKAKCGGSGSTSVRAYPVVVE